MDAMEMMEASNSDSGREPEPEPEPEPDPDHQKSFTPFTEVPPEVQRKLAMFLDLPGQFNWTFLASQLGFPMTHIRWIDTGLQCREGSRTIQFLEQHYCLVANNSVEAVMKALEDMGSLAALSVLQNSLPAIRERYEEQLNHPAQLVWQRPAAAAAAAAAAVSPKQVQISTEVKTKSSFISPSQCGLNSLRTTSGQSSFSMPFNTESSPWRSTSDEAMECESAASDRWEPETPIEQFCHDNDLNLRSALEMPDHNYVKGEMESTTNNNNNNRCSAVTRKGSRDGQRSGEIVAGNHNNRTKNKTKNVTQETGVSAPGWAAKKGGYSSGGGTQQREDASRMEETSVCSMAINACPTAEMAIDDDDYRPGDVSTEEKPLGFCEGFYRGENQLAHLDTAAESQILGTSSRPRQSKYANGCQLDLGAMVDVSTSNSSELEGLPRRLPMPSASKQMTGRRQPPPVKQTLGVGGGADVTNVKKPERAKIDSVSPPRWEQSAASTSSKDKVLSWLNSLEDSSTVAGPVAAAPAVADQPLDLTVDKQHGTAAEVQAWQGARRYLLENPSHIDQTTTAKKTACHPNNVELRCEGAFPQRFGSRLPDHDRWRDKELRNTYPQRVHSPALRDDRSSANAPTCGLSDASNKSELITSVSSQALLERAHFPEASRRVRVFITYSQDNKEHLRRVVGLGECLKKNGFSVSLEEMEKVLISSTKKEWHKTRFARADFILVVVSSKYQQEVEGWSPAPAPAANTAAFAVNPAYDPAEVGDYTLTTQYIYRLMLNEYADHQRVNYRFISLLFDGTSEHHIPQWLAGGNLVYRWPKQYKDVLYFMMKPELQVNRFVEEKRCNSEDITKTPTSANALHRGPPGSQHQSL